MDQYGSSGSPCVVPEKSPGTLHSIIEVKMLNQSPPASFSPARTWVIEAQAADITSMSLAWFRKKRQTGGGIPYTKMGRNVKYELADIYAYMDERKVDSTSKHQLLKSGSAD